jgi:hypothetical protein
VEIIAGSEVEKVGLAFTAQPPERVFVTKVHADSWAAGAGFQFGAEIVSVNGVRCEHSTAEAFKEQLQKKRPLHFVVLRGTAAGTATALEQEAAATRIQAYHRGNMARNVLANGPGPLAAKGAEQCRGWLSDRRQDRVRERCSQRAVHGAGLRGAAAAAAAASLCGLAGCRFGTATALDQEAAAARIQACHRGNMARKPWIGGRYVLSCSQPKARHSWHANRAWLSFSAGSISDMHWGCSPSDAMGCPLCSWLAGFWSLPQPWTARGLAAQS